MPTTSSRGLELFYEDRGSGPGTALLLHSFLCSGRMWDGQVDALASSYRVLVADARGHGRSSRSREAFTFYDSADDAIAVLDHAGVERAAWVGLSMGGMASLRAALVAPDRVERLVVLDSAAGTDPPVRRVRYSALGVVARIAGLPALRRQVERVMFGTTSLRERPELVRRWSAELGTLDVPSMLATLSALNGRDDLEPRLGEIRVPTTVIVGAEDRGQPPAVSRRIADGIDGARYVEIERAGHLSAVERPEAVAAALLDALV